MKQIRKLKPIRDISGKSRGMGVFYCEDCQSEVTRKTDQAKRQKSCGCSQYRHRLSITKLYHVWSDMFRRCDNPLSKSYHNYGGRGISISKQWGYFLNFRDWAISNGYVDGLEIDRRNNDGNYEPSNCRFVTHKENARNRRTTKLSMVKAGLIRSISKNTNLTQPEIGELFGVSHGTISAVVNLRIWKY